jgi:hypothetical protein
MRLRELQENEVVGLFKEHPLTDLPHAILEMLLDYYNLNSYGMATQKMKELTNSITAQLKQNGYTISHNEDVLQVTKGRDRYVAHEEEIMEMLLNTLFKDGIDEDVTQLKPQTSGTKYPLFSKQNIQKAYDEWYNGAAVDTDIEIIGNDNKRYIIRQNTDGDSQHFKDDHWYLTDANNNIEDTEGYPDPENLLFSHSAEGYEPKKPVDEDGTTDDDLADRIRNRGSPTLILNQFGNQATSLRDSSIKNPSIHDFLIVIWIWISSMKAWADHLEEAQQVLQALAVHH